MSRASNVCAAWVSCVALACSHALPGAPPAAATTAAYECDCAVLVDGERVQRPHCLHRAGDVYQMDPAAVAAFASPEAAPTFEASSTCGVFHVRRDGRALPTHPFDNGADYFCSGLARYVLDGKYGYMNRALEVVVPARYDFAFPFDAERGAVCNDCSQDRSGEHTTIRCASCGAVDRSGTLVLELELSSQEFFARYPAADCDDAPASE